MGRPEKSVEALDGAVAAFASELRRLRVQAGNPTYRDMARAALFSPSVLSSAASGHRLPTLQVTLGFVAACGGDRELWRQRWQKVSGSAHPQTVPRSTQHDPSAFHRALPRPAQLPRRAHGFVGRVEELRQLGAQSVTPVVITGPVGVGKSALALHYAHDIAADLADGQLYADFGSSASGGPDGQAVLDGFLLALGVSAGQLPGAADQRAGLYRSLLAARSLLVLLDNVRDEQQVRPLLAETQRSVTVVVGRTSLLGLRDVCRIRLDVLPRADSIAMIAAAVPDRAAADPQACDRLAELCGDLPLALDIAARKLVARPDIPLARAADRLAEPGAALEWLRVGDLSVRAPLRSAYLQLSDQAKALLHWLTWQPEEGSGAVVGTLGALGTAGAVEDELFEELVEAGMLRQAVSSGAYWLDPLARALVIDQDRRHGGPARAVEASSRRPEPRRYVDSPVLLTGGAAYVNRD